MEANKHLDDILEKNGLKKPESNPADNPAGDPPSNVVDDKFIVDFNSMFETSFKTRDEITAYRESLKKPVETKTEEEKLAEKKQKAIEHAIASNRFTKEEYEEFSSFASKPQTEIAKNIFIKEYKKENPDADETEVADAFEEFTFSSFPEGSFIRKMKNKDIERMVKSHLDETGSKFNRVVDEYDNHLKVTQLATSYKSIISEVVSEYTNEAAPKTIELPFADSVLSYRIPADVVKKAEEMYLAPEMFEAFGKNVDKKSVQEAIYNTIMLTEMPKIIKEFGETVRDQTKLKTLAGRKGVIPMSYGSSEFNGKDNKRGNPEVERATNK